MPNPVSKPAVNPSFSRPTEALSRQASYGSAITVKASNLARDMKSKVTDSHGPVAGSFGAQFLCLLPESQSSQDLMAKPRNSLEAIGYLVALKSAEFVLNDPSDNKPVGAPKNKKHIGQISAEATANHWSVNPSDNRDHISAVIAKSVLDD